MRQRMRVLGGGAGSNIIYCRMGVSGYTGTHLVQSLHTNTLTRATAEWPNTKEIEHQECIPTDQQLQQDEDLNKELYYRREEGRSK
jgi:hypothetical protein